MGLRCTGRFLIMRREPLISSALYGGLMDAVAEAGISVGPCYRMISSMGEVVGSDWYPVHQLSVCVGE